MSELPPGHTVNYWKTGKSDPDTLIDRAVKLIEGEDGEIVARGFMQAGNGEAA